MKTLEDHSWRQRLHDLEQQLLESTKKSGLFDPDQELQNGR
jgi:hypothetical protein